MNRIYFRDRGGTLTSIGLLVLIVATIAYLGETRMNWNLARHVGLGTTEQSPESQTSEPLVLSYDAKLALGGREVALQNPAYVKNGVVMVPMRETFEAAQAKVSYDPERDRAIATAGETQVSLRPGSQHAQIGRNFHRMVQPSELRDGILFVPLGLVEQALPVEVAEIDP